MEVAIFPTTLAERAELGPEPIRMPASWEEYVGLLHEQGLPLEFEDDQVIFMSIASSTHEAIVINIGGILFALFADDANYFYASSNRHVFIPEFNADYAPDAHLGLGVPQEHTLRKGLTANLNPRIIFEVLSPSTAEHDLGTKLPRYKKIPSVRQIVYVEQERPLISVFTRIGDSNRWENEDFDTLEQTLLIEDRPVRVQDFYRKVLFPGP